MPRAGALERGHIRLKLMRALAAGEYTQTELGRRFNVTQQAVSEFASRHAERIADIAGKLDDEFAGLWAAEKNARIATYQQQVEDVAELLDDPEQAIKAGVGYAETVRIAQTALRAIAEELGQLPGRMQVQHSGQLDVRLNGVDVGQLT